MRFAHRAPEQTSLVQCSAKPPGIKAYERGAGGKGLRGPCSSMGPLVHI